MDDSLPPSPHIDTSSLLHTVAHYTANTLSPQAQKAAFLDILSMIDLTTLEGADTPQKVSRLCQKALRLHREIPLPTTAAVCVYPPFIQTARKVLGSNSPVKIATVATAFPSGQTPLPIKLHEVAYAIDQGADEIDMVLSRGHFLAGEESFVFDEISQIKEACQGATLKVILETGELGTYDNVRRASDIAMYAGADFIKTSTGKISPAATLPVTFVMLHAIADFYQSQKRMVGMKPAGGISQAPLALIYLIMLVDVLGQKWLSPSFFRFGASSLADDVIAHFLRLS